MHTFLRSRFVGLFILFTFSCFCYFCYSWNTSHSVFIDLPIFCNYRNSNFLYSCPVRFFLFVFCRRQSISIGSGRVYNAPFASNNECMTHVKMGKWNASSSNNVMKITKAQIYQSLAATHRNSKHNRCWSLSMYSHRVNVLEACVHARPTVEILHIQTHSARTCRTWTDERTNDRARALKTSLPYRWAEKYIRWTLRQLHLNLAGPYPTSMQTLILHAYIFSWFYLAVWWILYECVCLSVAHYPFSLRCTWIKPVESIVVMLCWCGMAVCCCLFEWYGLRMQSRFPFVAVGSAFECF